LQTTTASRIYLGPFVQYITGIRQPLLLIQNVWLPPTLGSLDAQETWNFILKPYSDYLLLGLGMEAESISSK
jgi:hypothetical protein